MMVMIVKLELHTRLESHEDPRRTGSSQRSGTRQSIVAWQERKRSLLRRWHKHTQFSLMRTWRQTSAAFKERQQPHFQIFGGGLGENSQLLVRFCIGLPGSVISQP